MNLDNLVALGITTVLAVFGWLLRELWTTVKKLREDLIATQHRMPLDYIQKEDYRDDIARVHTLLDKIYEKLDNKAERVR